MVNITTDEASVLMKAARGAIENAVKKSDEFSIKDVPKNLMEKSGVFVTIYVNDELRGCIGYPRPTNPLINATVECAISAAFNDMRFAPIIEKDLKNMRLEVTVLTAPEEVKAKKRKDLVNEIKIGKDGIIVVLGIYSGLLLPQVAVEEDWDAETFLGQACMKAGLSAVEWLNDRVQVFKFQGKIFTESKGKTVEKKLV
jgi:hypothetical protein